MYQDVLIHLSLTSCCTNVLGPPLGLNAWNIFFNMLACGQLYHSYKGSPTFFGGCSFLHQGLSPLLLRSFSLLSLLLWDMDVSCASGQLAVIGGGPNIYCSSVHNMSQVLVLLPPRSMLVFRLSVIGCSPFPWENSKLDKWMERSGIVVGYWRIQKALKFPMLCGFCTLVIMRQICYLFPSTYSAMSATAIS